MDVQIKRLSFYLITRISLFRVKIVFMLIWKIPRDFISIDEWGGWGEIFIKFIDEQIKWISTKFEKIARGDDDEMTITEHFTFSTWKFSQLNFLPRSRIEIKFS